MSKELNKVIGGTVYRQRKSISGGGRVKATVARQDLAQHAEGAARGVESGGECCAVSSEVSRRFDLLVGHYILFLWLIWVPQLSMNSCLEASRGNFGQTCACFAIG